jgi:hypothetical protein
MIPARWTGRRQVARQLLLVAALALAASACAPDEGGDGGGGGGGTVKVGFVSPVTGFVAALGTDMRRGWEMYWQQNGAKAGDVTVQTVFEDDTGDPDVALTKARRLVEQEQVQLVAGPILAGADGTDSGLDAVAFGARLAGAVAAFELAKKYNPHIVGIDDEIARLKAMGGDAPADRTGGRAPAQGRHLPALRGDAHRHRAHRAARPQPELRAAVQR